LSGADLCDAYLSGANLSDAYLSGATNYVHNHMMFAEVVRRQLVSTFTDTEWAAIAQITICNLCWDSIRNRFSDVMPGLFDKLSAAGFGEWKEYWTEITK
jgi:hypothetical protein